MRRRSIDVLMLFILVIARIRIDTVAASGSCTKIWSGIDPTPPVAGRGISTFSLAKPVRTRRIKLYLDSGAFPGWNEIDAISIRDAQGRARWASAAWASSSYGRNRAAPSWFWP